MYENIRAIKYWMEHCTKEHLVKKGYAMMLDSNFLIVKFFITNHYQNKFW